MSRHYNSKQQELFKSTTYFQQLSRQSTSWRDKESSIIYSNAVFSVLWMFCAEDWRFWRVKWYIQHAGSIVFTRLPAWVYFLKKKFLSVEGCAELSSGQCCVALDDYPLGELIRNPYKFDLCPIRYPHIYCVYA